MALQNRASNSNKSISVTLGQKEQQNLLMFRYSCVYKHMLCKVRFPVESHRAIRTLIRFFATVQAHVVDTVMVVWKAARTVLTFKWLLRIRKVNFSMENQMRFRGKSFTAHIAHELLVHQPTARPKQQEQQNTEQIIHSYSSGAKCFLVWKDINLRASCHIISCAYLNTNQTIASLCPLK